MIISEQDLAALRVDAISALSVTCTITHRAIVNSGSEQTATTTTTPDVPCQVLGTSSNSAVESEIAAGVQSRQIVPIMLPFDQTISEHDSITVDVTGEVFEVIRIDCRTSRVLQRVLCAISEEE